VMRTPGAARIRCRAGSRSCPTDGAHEHRLEGAAPALRPSRYACVSSSVVSMMQSRANSGLIRFDASIGLRRVRRYQVVRSSMNSTTWPPASDSPSARP
jgi:hypothetical protein